MSRQLIAEASDRSGGAPTPGNDAGAIGSPSSVMPVASIGPRRARDQIGGVACALDVQGAVVRSHTVILSAIVAMAAATESHSSHISRR